MSETRPPSRILVAIDGSGPADRALRVAAGLARLTGTTIVGMHVAVPVGPRLATRRGPPFEPRRPPGAPAGDQPFLTVRLRVGEESRIGRELPDRARAVAGAAPSEVGSAFAAARLVVELASAPALAGVP